jgi:hypothetical protein
MFKIVNFTLTFVGGAVLENFFCVIKTNNSQQSWQTKHFHKTSSIISPRNNVHTEKMMKMFIIVDQQKRRQLNAICHGFIII